MKYREIFDPQKQNTFLPEETSILTEDGWKNISACLAKKIVTLSLDGTISMSKVTQLNIKKADETFLHFDSGKVNVQVPAYCKMPIYKYMPHSPQRIHADISFVSAKQLSSTQRAMKISGLAWHGDDTDTFILPGLFYRASSDRTIPYPPLEIPLRSWLNFFGKWMKSGYIEKNKVIFSYKGKTADEKALLIKKAIEALGFKTLVSHIGRKHIVSIFSPQLSQYLNKTLAYPARIPRAYFCYKQQYLQILSKSYFDDSSKDSVQTYHKKREDAEAIQELILKSYGTVTQIKEHASETYLLSFKKNSKKETVLYPSPSTNHETTKAYAITLDKNEIILIKQNGIISWVGCYGS